MYSGGPTFWLPGVSPGTVPPVPTKTALMPGDIYTDNQPGMPVAPNGVASYANMIALWMTAGGYLPDASEKLAWRTATTKKVRYVNFDAVWYGSHWASAALGTTKTTLTPTSSVIPYSKQSFTLALGAVADADRVAVMGSFYVASPLTSWAASENVWVGNCIMTWNGTSWVQVAKTPTIHEAATYPCTPGDVFLDSRVTGTGNAASLLGWGYVPLYRAAWTGRIDTAIGATSAITFWNPDAPTTIGFSYYWNGTAWAPGSSALAGTVVAVGATVTDAALSALPAAEQVAACTLFGYYSSTGAQWTTGQSATIAGNVVHWHGAASRRYWAPGAAP
jgi:hypothetical protein